MKTVGITKFLKVNSRKPYKFMEDGAPAHRAKTTQKWLQDRGVKKLEGWPGNSPDLNPIKNLWSEMKHLQRKKRATSIEGLKKIARKVWRQVSAKYLEKLYESLPRCMEAVIAAGGGHTKYWKKNIDEIVNVVWINELFLKVNEDFCSR